MFKLLNVTGDPIFDILYTHCILQKTLKKQKFNWLKEITKVIKLQRNKFIYALG